MNNLECKSCGNTLKPQDSHCPYCGTSNPKYEEKKKPLDLNVFASRSESSSKPNEKSSTSEINVCVLIILVIVFWPAAVVYALVKMNKWKLRVAMRQSSFAFISVLYY